MHYNPQAGTPPWAGTPPAVTPPGQIPTLPSACWDTPPAQCMLGYSPRAVHPGIRSTIGRYASHWNAFLFFSLFDAGEERYRKLKETISRITPLQIGEYI